MMDPITTVKLVGIDAQPTQAVISWKSDQPAQSLAEAYISHSLDGLADEALRFIGRAPLPGPDFQVGPLPFQSPYLIPETIYYVRANTDDVLSDIRGFNTPPSAIPPSPILLRMFAQSVEITRPGWGIYDSTGKFVQIQGTSFQAICSFQPLGLREMMIFPEGERSNQMVRIYSDVRLIEASQITGQKGDRFEYNGRQYEVKQTGTWNAPGRTRIRFFKSVAVSVEQDTQT